MKRFAKIGAATMTAAWLGGLPYETAVLLGANKMKRAGLPVITESVLEAMASRFIQNQESLLKRRKHN